MGRVLSQAMQQAIAANDIAAIKRCYHYGARVSNKDAERALRQDELQPATLAFLYKLGISPSGEHIAITVRNNKPELLEVVLQTMPKPLKALNQLDKNLAATIVHSNATDVPAYLAWAAQKGHVKLVEMLLSYGASPTLPDSNGEPPIHYALLGNCVEVIELIEAAVVRERKSSNTTPVDAEEAAQQKELAQQFASAIYYRDLPAIDVSLAAKPPLDASVGADYWWPVVGVGHPLTRQIALLLLKNGVSPFEDSLRGPAAFTKAVLCLDTEMVNLFLTQNLKYLNQAKVWDTRPDINALEAVPLGYALTQRGYYADKFVQYLLTKGAHLDDVNALGETAGELAKRVGSPVAKKLLEEFSLTGRVPAFTVDFAPDYAVARAVEMGEISVLRAMHKQGLVNLADVRIQRYETTKPESLLEFVLATRLPFEQLREMVQFLVAEIGVPVDESSVEESGNFLELMGAYFQLGDTALVEIILGAMSPTLRKFVLDNTEVLFFAVHKGSASLLRSLLAWGVNPLGITEGTTTMRFLDEEHYHLPNYAELRAILQAPHEAAMVALKEIKPNLDKFVQS